MNSPSNTSLTLRISAASPPLSVLAIWSARSHTAELIAVGTEILLGNIANAHAIADRAGTQSE